MLELRNIHYAAGGKTLLALNELSITPGKVTAILGPNGAGKTTALKLLSGETRALVGEVTLDGEAVAAMAPEELARRRAVITQNAGLSFDFFVWEVVALGRQPHAQTSSREIDRRIICDALARVDCLGLAERRFLTLSGGERQRVHFARALAQVMEPVPDASPKYLLLDEPTSALDLKFQIDCLERARDFAHEGGGVAVILHDLNLASAYADDIYLLSGGRVAVSGPAREVLTARNIQDVYGLTDERLGFAMSGLQTPRTAENVVPLPRMKAAE